MKLDAYLCSAGVWTIGYGTTMINGKKVTQGMKISLEQAEQYLIKDCQKFYDAVCKEVGNICNDNQIASLTSFSYNVGVGISFAETERLKQQGKKVKIGFRNSGLLRVIKANPNNFPEIEKQFMQWVYAGGKFTQGLENRRKEEIKLYCAKD